MKKTLLLLFALLVATQIKAQTIQEKAIGIAIGYGMSTPYDDIDITGQGFYLQGEYVLEFTNWFALKPYAGLILTKADEDDNPQNAPNYIATANAFLFGAKARFTAPIPWVAPYVEAGIGASVGSFETVTPFTNLEESGLLYHIPLSLGLELGPRRNFDMAFTYYFHPSVEQFAGAVAIGITIPLRTN